MTTSRLPLTLLIVAVVLAPGCTMLKVLQALENPEVERVGESLIDKIPAPTRDSTDPYRASQGARIAFLPGKVDFGTVGIGDSTRQLVRIVNHYSFPVSVTRVSTAGGAFQVSQTPAPVVLVPGGEHTVVVEFTPTSTKRHRGSLIVELDASAARFLRMPLEGRGK